MWIGGTFNNIFLDCFTYLCHSYPPYPFVSINLQDSSVAVLRRGGIGEYEMVKSIVDRHKDYVTDLLYLQQTSQLITCSWDKTIAIGVLDIASIL